MNSGKNKFKARPSAKPALQALAEKNKRDLFNAQTLRPGIGPGIGPGPGPSELSKIFAAPTDALVLKREPKHESKRDDETPATFKAKSANEVRTSKVDKKKQHQIHPLIFLLIGMGVGALLFSAAVRSRGSFPNQDQTQSRARMEERQRWQENVQYEREHLGAKLNRQRVEVEYQNQRTAPGLGDDTARVPKVKAPDMMRGLPLESESFASGAHDRLEPVNPDDPEARTQSALEEEKNLREFEDKADKLYRDEFVANAARAGYAIRIDRNGVAKVVGKVPKVTPLKVDDRFPSDVDRAQPGSSR